MSHHPESGGQVEDQFRAHSWSKQNGNIETHQHSPGRGTKSDRVQEVFEPYSQTQGLNSGGSCGGTGAGIDKILPTQDIPRF